MAKIARFAANLYDMEEKDIKPTDTEMDINADSDVPGTAHLNEPVKEVSELEKLELELAEMKDKYLRQAAEFDNFRKRTAKERLELIQTAGKEVIGQLLEVLDDTERAQKQMENSQDIAALKEGAMLIFNKLRTVLNGRGLKAMETIGTPFNPDLHEAITEIPVPEMAGKVIDEVEKGYYLNDKIIRFAKVVVGK
ncbi:nucleotide exchange factor GrpE [Flavihumibacter sp. CACIAM 22H1]|uniref:nucleotide exchange factor GrpE n=1 Tax=Flavihumibacter sp. CACIAM 22H1 TaxID=1812911 RepID=UPI0025B80303|nr:nucleotide exchange factor GrpE [Flavihumibacter sp. CACIAM 22H1]